MSRTSTSAVHRTATCMGALLVAALCVPAPSSAAAAPSCHGHRATIVGTDDKDRITGTSGRDVIAARGGPDRIDARGGDDLVCGGFGRDVVNGGRGADVLDGQADGRFWDEGWFYVGDVLGGGPGSDRVIGGDSHTGDHATFVNAERGVRVDTRKGTATGQGKDRLVGITSVAGSDHADTITVAAPDETTSGRGGDDSLTATGYASWLTGGLGNDRVRLERGGAASGDEGDDELNADGKRWSSLSGGDGDDTIDGGPGRDSAYPGTGADTVVLRAGADSVDDGTGDDELIGGPGNDYLANDRGAARISGGDGDDTLFGGRGDDDLEGGPGSDTVKYLLYEAPEPVTVDLAEGSASGGQGNDRIDAAENIIGSPYDDLLLGDDGPNAIESEEGEDVVRARGGDDRIRTVFGTVEAYAGPGDDRIEFEYHDDSVAGNGFDGGAGADTFDVRNSWLGSADPDDLVIDLEQGLVRARGTADLLGFENAIGNWSASTIIGNDLANTVSGHEGRDLIEGGGSDDTLDGGDGNDRGDGGAGTDTCTSFETVTACEQ